MSGWDFTYFLHELLRCLLIADRNGVAVDSYDMESCDVAGHEIRDRCEFKTELRRLMWIAGDAREDWGDTRNYLHCFKALAPYFDY